MVDPGALTPEQLIILRRVVEGTGAPARRRRSGDYWREVELLAYVGLVAIRRGALCPTALGIGYLAALDRRAFFEDFLGVPHGAA